MTPTTPPISRAAVTAAAAIPERSAGSRPSTISTIGATTSPMPAPMTASRTAIGTPRTGRPSVASSAARATAATSKPATSTGRAPLRAAHRPPAGPASTITSVIGVNTAAVCRPENPPTTWRSRLTSSSTENNANVDVEAATSPAPTVRSARARRSTTAAVLRRSTRTNATPAAHASPQATTTRLDVNP